MVWEITLHDPPQTVSKGTFKKKSNLIFWITTPWAFVRWGLRLALVTPYDGWKVTNSRDRPFSADIGCFFFFLFYFLQQTGLLPDTRERHGPSTGLYQPYCPCLRKENWDLLRPRSKTNVFLQISKFFSGKIFNWRRLLLWGGGSTGDLWQHLCSRFEKKKEWLTKRITASFIALSQSQVLWVQNKRWCDCRDDLAAPGPPSALI